MLMKLTPGVIVINALQEDFTLADTKSAKMTENITLFFALSRFAGKKSC